MNMKSIFGMIGDVIGGLAGILGGLVSVGVLSQIVFGSGWLGINIVENISTLVGTFLGAGLTGLLTLVILIGLWDNK